MMNAVKRIVSILLIYFTLLVTICSEEEREARVIDMADSFKNILERLGEDPQRQGLLKTPERAAKAIMYFTKGYEENIAG